MKIIFIGPYSEAMILKNLLENSGITVYTQNEAMSTIEPVAISAGGYNTVTLKVAEEDFQQANEILTGYNSGAFDLTD